MSRFEAILRDESGGVIIIVAAGLTGLCLMVALVVDVANWKVHTRHLQLQADAAALAAARALGSSGCSNATVSAKAHEYAGPDASGAVALYNGQVGGTPASKMHILINSSGYYGDAGAGDYTESTPCAAGYIDIKASETDLPWFLGFGGIVSKINAHARVSLLQQGAANGTLPIAVPNPKPKSAAAIFINEATGGVLGSTRLGDAGESGDLNMYSTLDPDPDDPPPTCPPDELGVPATVQVATHTSVVIALSGRNCLSLSGTLAEICQQSLTDCYDASADPPAQGLSYIRGFNPNGTGDQPNPPLLRTVELIPSAGCPNGAYFSNNDTGCVYDIYARIDTGTVPNANVIIMANGGIQLFSVPESECDKLNKAGSGGCWHATATLPAASGPNNITMTWEETSGCLDAIPCSDKKAIVCKVGGGNKCKGSFENGVTVQRAYSARQADTGFSSGPIKVLTVGNCDGDPTCSQPKQSFPVDSTHTFAVTIGVAGILRNAQDVNAPPVVLRVRSAANQALDCDPGYTNLKTELALGCRPTYVPNSGDPDCATLGTSALWASAQPWSCIAVSTGQQPNQIAAGLNARFYLGDEQPTTCAPIDPITESGWGHNNWHLFDASDPKGDGTYGLPPGDPRILNAYITTYGAFSHVTGTSGSVPVVGFGHFYVTGYTGQGGGFDNPCYPGPPSNYSGLWPDDPVPNNDPGLIVGRFIYYVDTVGGDGTQPCDPASIFACVAVMTK
jgi:hypothetical protein